MNRRNPRRSIGLGFQTLERRNLLAGDIGQNFVEAGDVNLDGHVTARDALNIINEISRQSETSGDTMLLADVDGSGKVTSGDALRVINQLAQGARDAESLKEGVDQLASAILTENLPEGMRSEIANLWLQRLEERMESPPQQRGAFNQLDSNGDGRISKDEVAADIWARMLAADADEDGTVTKDEIQTPVDPPTTPVGPPVDPPTTPVDPPVDPPTTRVGPPVDPPTTPVDPPVDPPTTPVGPPVDPPTTPVGPPVDPPTKPIVGGQD